MAGIISMVGIISVAVQEPKHSALGLPVINPINFAACIVSGTRKFDHASPALKDLRWIPVKSHLYLRDAILAFKSMTGQVPNYLSSNFISRGNISGRMTRSSSQLNIPLSKTKSGQRSFYYRTVTLWNASSITFKSHNGS